MSHDAQAFELQPAQPPPIENFDAGMPHVSSQPGVESHVSSAAALT